jgi:hypothetical protein
MVEACAIAAKSKEEAKSVAPLGTKNVMTLLHSFKYLFY